MVRVCWLGGSSLLVGNLDAFETDDEGTPIFGTFSLFIPPPPCNNHVSTERAWGALLDPLVTEGASW